MRSRKWDERYLRLARFVAGFSKDASTQVGAVIVDEDRRIIALGFNGLPRGVKDLPSRQECRQTKLKYTIHAEPNAILFAQRDLTGATIYTWPFAPCAQCSAMIAQAKLARVVCPPTPPDLLERWGEDLRVGSTIFREANVILDTMALPGEEEKEKTPSPNTERGYGYTVALSIGIIIGIYFGILLGKIFF